MAKTVEKTKKEMAFFYIRLYLRFRKRQFLLVKALKSHKKQKMQEKYIKYIEKLDREAIKRYGLVQKNLRKRIVNILCSYIVQQYNIEQQEQQEIRYVIDHTLRTISFSFLEFGDDSLLEEIFISSFVDENPYPKGV